MRGYVAGLLVMCGGCFSGGGGPPIFTFGDAGVQSLGDLGRGGGDEAAQHNLATINAYRAQAGERALVLDATLTQFATAASQDLAAGGGAHAYFQRASQNGTLFSSGFCGGAAENQAPGWPLGASVDATIDDALASMMSEGPGGGHHDNIVDPQSALLGVGVVQTAGGLYLTNDFSPPCP